MTLDQIDRIQIYKESPAEIRRNDGVGCWTVKITYKGKNYSVGEPYDFKDKQDCKDSFSKLLSNLPNIINRMIKRERHDNG